MILSQKITATRNWLQHSMQEGNEYAKKQLFERSRFVKKYMLLHYELLRERRAYVIYFQTTFDQMKIVKTRALKAWNLITMKLGMDLN